MEVPTDDNATEAQLVTYLKNILKVQIRPMKYDALAGLVADAPKKFRKKLVSYVQEKYPNGLFEDFLAKYPDIFKVRRDRTVILADGNEFTRDRTPDQVDGDHFLQDDRIPDEIDGDRIADEVDGDRIPDEDEYVSGSSCSSDDDEQDTDKDDQEAQMLLEDTFGGDLVRVRLETMNGSEASISSDSEDGAFMAENPDSQSSFCSCVSESCSCGTPSSQEN
ncbi:hypothetical protein JTE90_018372 [Oedothorax gibbosus]|uniref:Egal-1 winged helix domain-containing protein n=1 Tax=Oedothorax gibbosus TaxID=931172 RepID=A0AAV6UCJ9_9ARAC|nr:hypothetical protein JTE90_018372 [Oedothorax gibbosus]